MSFFEEIIYLLTVNNPYNASRSYVTCFPGEKSYNDDNKI